MPKWKKILYALLAAVVLVAAAWTTLTVLDELGTCADGIERVDDECIGVDGTGYDFGTPEIRAVAHAIAAENARIADEPHVTVAMMLPLQSDQPALRRQMRSDLQGAYLGQRQANKGEGEPPRIRLVLANPGRDYGHQARIVDTLLRMADSSEDRLRAVTGFNLSLDETEAAVERLTKERIPVLASRISGDRIANKESADGLARPEFPGLARILPTNGQAAQALANFHGEQGQQNHRTVLVYDRRPRDRYNESLAKAFSGIKEKGPDGPAPMSFESPSIDAAGDTGNQFTDIAHNICGSEADTVYFAGRTLHLRLFALKLAEVGCEDRAYTVISGSDAASLRQTMADKDWAQLRGDGSRPRVTVQYAAPAHPEAWATELSRWKKEYKSRHHRAPTPQELPQYLTEPAKALDTLNQHIRTVQAEGKDLGSTPSLKDSRTMLVYDGLITIGKALHQAQTPGTDTPPTPKDVGTRWPLFQSRHRIQATSGLICLTNAGNPYDKPAAVVELDPGRTGRGTLKFVGLGWPENHPQPRDCVVPDGRS
ncbi:MAG TPA: amino acid ABC transporter substrate-binding protein [Streptomyces sp.]|nr:amino acid ABC transporter substrate-binding protein [Streptomyces sp.]